MGTVIKNVKIINEGEILERDLLIEDEYISKIDKNISVNNHVFTGININMHETLFEETKVFEEFGYAYNSNVQRIFFKEDLLAYGTGFSFQLGSIIKIKQLRVGLSYSTPTTLNIEEESSQIIETDIIEKDGLKTYRIDPNTINVYDEYFCFLMWLSTFIGCLFETMQF